MAHIIGKPPAPKGGATFGDARRHDVFDALDPEDPGDPGDSEAYVRWVKSSATTAYQLTAPKAGAGIRFSPDWSIVPLNITPRDPEPDPAVCTSDGLTKGQWYEGADGALTLRGDVIDLDVNGESDDHLPPGDPATFRRVAASVVEHGELGHNEAGIGVSPSYGDLHNVSLGHGNRRLHREELEELVRRVVAYLAWLDTQQAASPESGEPVQRHDPRHPDFKPISYPEPAEDRPKPVVDQERRTYSFPMAEPAEDRSKPAPGSPNTPEPPPLPANGPAVWDLVITDMRERDEGGLAKYGTRLQAGNGRNALVDAYQEALDLAVYLRQRIAEDDAQQAGKGGES